MPRPTEREIDDSYDREGLILDDQDLDLLHHVFTDDAPRQGLHQHGDWKDSEED